MWLCGQTFIAGGSVWQLKPFRKIKGIDLRADTRSVFDLEWKPIFNKMMEAPDNIVPHEITEEYVLSSYTRGTLFLKENYSYIFTRSSDVLSKYTIGTWSKKIKPSEVRRMVQNKTSNDCLSRLLTTRKENKRIGRNQL